MFDYCNIEDKKCPFCAKRDAGVFCGVANGENRIELMGKCPLPEIKKRSRNKSKKMGL